MSKKKKHYKNKEELTREDVYKKPIFARLYDKVNPGDYTIRQDFMHSLFFFGAIVVIALLIWMVIFGTTMRGEEKREAKLTIPQASFVKGQENTVAELLSGYGFVDIDVDDRGNIIAYGTQNMVQAYKDSYRDKNIDEIEDMLEEDYSEIGINAINITPDYRTLTIQTYLQATDDLNVLKPLLNDDISNMITKLSIWCGIRNDGEPLTTEFVNTFTEDGQSPQVYYTTQRFTADQIIADIESEQNSDSSDSQGEESATQNDDNTDNTDNTDDATERENN